MENQAEPKETNDTNKIVGALGLVIYDDFTMDILPAMEVNKQRYDINPELINIFASQLQALVIKINVGTVLREIVEAKKNAGTSK